ncbi:MAG: 4-hydroxy-tetrahydrodipicolinate synthase [Porticoccaceae bacterium]|tara:strand:- start:2701 stop:3579 length:879 start_codon:yes stop_codon:yes gene_type:complete
MITGSIVALVTPMVPDTLDVDWEALERLVEWHIDQQTHALVAVGTTGESATLSVDEHSRVIKFMVDISQGRIPVIAGTGANCTREAIELTEAAKKAGADACLLVTPYYNKPTQEGLYQHYKAIAEAVDIDQILYNVPSRSACDMLPETALRLSEISNIVGIKEATGDLDRAAWLIDNSPKDFAIYSGDDHTARELMLLGGHGDISVTANVAPKEMSRMCEAAINGDAEQALDIDKQLLGLHDAMFVESNPIPVKWAVSQLGLINDAIRLPLTQLSKANQVKVLQALKSASVF